MRHLMADCIMDVEYFSQQFLCYIRAIDPNNCCFDLILFDSASSVRIFFLNAQLQEGLCMLFLLYFGGGYSTLKILIALKFSIASLPIISPALIIPPLPCL